MPEFDNGWDDLVELLPHLPEDADLQLSVSVADLRQAYESAKGGPDLLSTRQAADYIGYTPKRWRRWAKEGKIDGAYQDEKDRWRLPNQACRAFIEDKYHSDTGGRRGPQDRGGAETGRSSSP